MGHPAFARVVQISGVEFPMRRSLFALAAVVVLAAPAFPQQPKPNYGSHGFLEAAATGLVTSTAQFGANMISQTLESALRRSRDAARADSKPIPAEIKDALVPFYPAELLADVRYSIGDTSPSGLAGFAIRNGNAAAVTLIDTIVFKDEKYVHSLSLWAHEVHHVEQYKEWGVDGFATRYAFDWQHVESEASDRAQAFVAWYKERTGQ